MDGGSLFKWAGFVLHDDQAAQTIKEIFRRQLDWVRGPAALLSLFMPA
jgi:hypothetical protein